MKNWKEVCDRWGASYEGEHYHREMAQEIVKLEGELKTARARGYAEAESENCVVEHKARQAERAAVVRLLGGPFPANSGMDSYTLATMIGKIERGEHTEESDA